ncbi:single-stranded-DNA-specific exonuclease RecJ [Candidatus Kaiserbacteria bacterium RIFCSPHIGHO2_01_FULL_51_33]|uniref:Single-stranded-DNA-specific exonuclease RecJ n=1 Tax=Candidatus Kaiserbacteria bacterium RIFCSPLOWO2_01_FULL_51_21 TaxID=1798508 RepID=A0A1F6ECU2_9BACT|nr:MAG: single-stranded-DNA-specific exonuclease RecJ [Candidatus Kaiserbacteria bacterium RIFCSPHIGHO2_01_FULL_51_33]OGG71410.1 MAG: single-stranded-DNA-specific exonuclease RecJ [Candidatus Kaiserbacteria bacterium RIFCSPLOWO2_01_FULL_51_21]
MESEKAVSERFDGEMVLAQYPRLLRSLLLARGITTEEAAELFLKPDYERDLHDPFLMQDMERAVARILGAMRSEETIVVYSDYDCDGIPGGVILHDFFKRVGYSRFTNYIPHRHREGYGLNSTALEGFAESGASLLITVDCGTTDIEAIARAREIGIDVIVTDHHLPGEAGLPDAYAVLNPHREGETYPFRELCGSGLAFKLVQGLMARGNFNVPAGWEKWLLDMAGLGTLADMVPLLGENRALAHFGLVVLRRSPRLGLQKLCRRMKVKQNELTEDDVGFMLVPRINAASRMDAPMDAFRLLTTHDETTADELSEHLDRINDERKGVVASMVKEIRKRMEDRAVSGVIVMGDPRWKPALLGLAANTLAEEYARPVFLWGREADLTIKGSCRSDGSVNVVELMRARSDLFLDFGGHQFSGGFSVVQEKVHLLEVHLVEALALSVRVEIPLSAPHDGELSLADVTWETYRQIASLSPFGKGNPKPVFRFPKVVIAEVRQFGKEQKHLELRFAHGGRSISAIGFFMKPEDFIFPLVAGNQVDLTATIERSTFRHFPELRLRIVGLEFR